MSSSDKKRKLQELAAKRRAEAAEAAEASEEKKQQKRTNSPSGSAGSPKEKKSPSVRSSPVKSKSSSPLKPRGGRAATHDKYVEDGFIDDDEDVLDSESQPSSGGHFTVSDEALESDYSDNVGPSKKKKKKVTSSTKKPKGSNNKKKTTKRRKIENDDEDSSEEEIVKKKPSKKNKKKKVNSDGSDEDLSDIRKDELESLDTNQIIKGRRTRGKKIDFTGQDPYDDYE